jgi:hypothetical protein
VASSNLALEKLSVILKNYPLSIERLVRQHEVVFLQQLTAAILGASAHEFGAWQRAFEVFFSNFTEGVFRDSFGQKRLDRRWVGLIFWQIIFENLSRNPSQKIDNQWFVSPLFLNQLFNRVSSKRLSMTEWAFEIINFITQKQDFEILKQTTKRPSKNQIAQQITALKGAIKQAVSVLPESDKLESLFENWLFKDLKLASEFLEKAALKTQNTDGVTTNNLRFENTDSSNKPLGTQNTEGEENKDLRLNNTANTPLETQNSKLKTEDEDTVFYVGMAGVVILHPFLAPFFETVGLLEGTDFKDENARKRGVGLLQYLAVGDEMVAEYDASLLKWLCGLPFEQPIDAKIELTRLERTEANELLETVIEHWGALGKVSADSLRDGFLKRDGKLTRRTERWVLQVEKQTLDILLDRLPWGFGVIKLSWQAEILFVEW